MRLSLRRHFIGFDARYIVLMPLFLISSCICSSDGVNEGDINLVPIEEEWQFGAQMAQELQGQVQLVNDAPAQAYLERLGQRLVAETNLADRPWHFYLIADTTVNAFAMPGGHIFINTGLVMAAENVAEFASVMAHEVAHVTARHSTEQMTKLYGLNFIARLVLGDSPGFLEQIAAQFLGSGAVAKFSRDDEREADRLGLQYLHGAGYDPDQMASMFEILLQNRRQRPNLVERFFTSHPLTEERIEAVRTAANALPEGESLIERDEDFQQIQRRLAKYNFVKEL